MKRLLIALLLFPLLLNAQDLLVKKNGDTINVVITNVSNTVIEYSMPMEKAVKKVNCKVKFATGMSCANMTRNTSGYCDLHHPKDNLAINRDDLKSFRRDSYWKIKSIQYKSGSDDNVFIDKIDDANILIEELKEENYSQNIIYNRRLDQLERRMSFGGQDIKKAGNSFLLSFYFMIASAGVAVISSNNSNTALPYISVGLGVTSIVCFVNGSAKLKKGGDYLSLNSQSKQRSREYPYLDLDE